MNIKALVTAVVLGSSSIALAAPSSFGPPAHNVRDHRVAPVKPMPQVAPAPARVSPFAPRWVTLASSAKVSGQAHIRVPSNRTFSKLELRTTGNRAKIDRVAIRYSDGRTQTVRVRNTQNGRQPVTIDLPSRGRSIQALTVYGNTGRRGALDIRAI
jgi:hypothetical protein